MRLPAAAFIVLTAVAAGCTDLGEVPDAGDAPERFAVWGTFTKNATEEQMTALGDYVQERDGDLLRMESFPVQFRAIDLSAEACDSVREFSETRPYVEDIGSCSLMTSGGGDAPASDA